MDLVCAKVMGAPKRAQDLEDLCDLRPTAAELDFVEDHLQRLAQESLDNETFQEQWGVVEGLRGTF